MAAKRKPVIVGDMMALPEKETRSWAQSHGTFIAGQARIDEADKAAVAMEAKWGAGRLRLLVGPDLREKFDRQRYLLNRAIWHGQLEDVRHEAGRMVKAWQALDRHAEQAGAPRLLPQVLEIALEDGSVAAIVPDNESASLVNAEGRKLSVYTLDEIGRLLVGFPTIAKAKLSFPGAEVVRVTRSIPDPLDAIVDTDLPIDEVPF